MLTDNPREACVHIVPLSLVSTERLKGYANGWKDTFSSVVGFRPTGWTCVTLCYFTLERILILPLQDFHHRGGPNLSQIFHR